MPGKMFSILLEFVHVGVEKVSNTNVFPSAMQTYINLIICC